MLEQTPPLHLTPNGYVNFDHLNGCPMLSSTFYNIFLLKILHNRVCATKHTFLNFAPKKKGSNQICQ
jgi:hypothetical protein